MKRSRIDPLWVIVAIAAVGTIGVYLWSHREPVAEPEVPPLGPIETPSTGPAHPLAPLPADQQAPLPPLEASDPVVVETAEKMLAGSPWRDLLQVDNAVRRWVITIDALPRERIVQRTSAARPVAGEFAVEGEPEAFSLSSANFARYEAFVALAESVDPATLVGAYRRLYPLFQQVYTELIRPDGYFNDRLVEVLDHLLATPEFPQDVQLSRPSVMYRYADPELEAMSVGRKALLRMGPDNARRVKAVLERVRSELVATSSSGPG
jgi:hypothetical protein